MDRIKQDSHHDSNAQGRGEPSQPQVQDETLPPDQIGIGEDIDFTDAIFGAADELDIGMAQVEQQQPDERQ
jgi:hypothetical protein